jgi:hypothetical protein
MRTAEYAKDESSIWYEIDLPALMEQIVDANIRDMNDPAGIAGRIPACSSDDMLRTTKNEMGEAIRSLRAAEAARDKNNPSTYWLCMWSVFGMGFPYPQW